MISIERTIQWYGIIRPSVNFDKYKYWRLTADLVKPPLSTYVNRRYPNPQGFWGYVQSIYAQRVLQTYRLSYDSEIVAYDINTNLFLQQNISCHLEATLTSFINLGLFVAPGYPTQRDNPIKDWVNLSFPIDEFRVRLLTEDTIFKFQLDYELQENCQVPLSSLPPDPIPKPPTPPIVLNPETEPIDYPDISPPYDGNNDNGFTYNPGQSNQFPLGSECTAYFLTFSYEIDSNGNGNYITQQETIRVYGIVYNLVIMRNANGDPNVFCDCQGLPDFEPCDNNRKVVGITGFSGLGMQANIRNPLVISLVS